MQNLFPKSDRLNLAKIKEEKGIAKTRYKGNKARKVVKVK